MLRDFVIDYKLLRKERVELETLLSSVGYYATLTEAVAELNGDNYELARGYVPGDQCQVLRDGEVVALRLLEDVTLTQPLVLAEPCFLDLNGHILTVDITGDESGDYVTCVSAAGQVVIYGHKPGSKLAGRAKGGHGGQQAKFIEASACDYAGILGVELSFVPANVAGGYGIRVTGTFPDVDICDTQAKFVAPAGAGSLVAVFTDCDSLRFERSSLNANCVDGAVYALTVPRGKSFIHKSTVKAQSVGGDAFALRFTAGNHKISASEITGRSTNGQARGVFADGGNYHITGCTVTGYSKNGYVCTVRAGGDLRMVGCKVYAKHAAPADGDTGTGCTAVSIPYGAKASMRDCIAESVTENPENGLPVAISVYGTLLIVNTAVLGVHSGLGNHGTTYSRGCRYESLGNHGGVYSSRYEGQSADIPAHWYSKDDIYYRRPQPDGSVCNGTGQAYFSYGTVAHIDGAVFGGEDSLQPLAVTNTHADGGRVYISNSTVPAFRVDGDSNSAAHAPGELYMGEKVEVLYPSNNSGNGVIVETGEIYREEYPAALASTAEMVASIEEQRQALAALADIAGGGQLPNGEAILLETATAQTVNAVEEALAGSKAALSNMGVTVPENATLRDVPGLIGLVKTVRTEQGVWVPEADTNTATVNCSPGAKIFVMEAASVIEADTPMKVRALTYLDSVALVPIGAETAYDAFAAYQTGTAAGVRGTMVNGDNAQGFTATVASTLAFAQGQEYRWTAYYFD